MDKIQARCETCWKRLFIESKELTQAVINLAVYHAENHERRHPTHQTEVLISKNAEQRDF